MGMRDDEYEPLPICAWRVRTESQNGGAPTKSRGYRLIVVLSSVFLLGIVAFIFTTLYYQRPTDGNAYEPSNEIFSSPKIAMEQASFLLSFLGRLTEIEDA